MCIDGWVSRMAGVDATETSTKGSMTSIFPTTCQLSRTQWLEIQMPTATRRSIMTVDYGCKCDLKDVS